MKFSKINKNEVKHIIIKKIKGLHLMDKYDNNRINLYPSWI